MDSKEWLNAEQFVRQQPPALRERLGPVLVRMADAKQHFTQSERWARTFGVQQYFADTRRAIASATLRRLLDPVVLHTGLDAGAGSSAPPVGGPRRLVYKTALRQIGMAAALCGVNTQLQLQALELLCLARRFQAVRSLTQRWGVTDARCALVVCSVCVGAAGGHGVTVEWRVGCHCTFCRCRGYCTRGHHARVLAGTLCLACHVSTCVCSPTRVGL